jgi:hypothetical protein
VAKKKKKKKSKPFQPPGPPASVHHLIDVKDIPTWGAGTLCGERASSGTNDHTKVTYTACKRGTNWDVERYRAACIDPIHIT